MFPLYKYISELSKPVKQNFTVEKYGNHEIHNSKPLVWNLHTSNIIIVTDMVFINQIIYYIIVFKEKNNFNHLCFEKIQHFRVYGTLRSYVYCPRMV